MNLILQTSRAFFVYLDKVLVINLRRGEVHTAKGVIHKPRGQFRGEGGLAK